MTDPSTPWRICVDTGGTFTDCVAFTPDGDVRRAKILSSSAIRGSVESQPTSSSIVVSSSWSFPEAFVRGQHLTIGSGRSEIASVIDAFNPADRRLELRTAIPGVPPGTTFEIQFNEEAPVVACRLVTGTPAGAPLPPIRLRLATTRGTNALLTRRGDPPVLFITKGFADLLEIGTQQRPDLFALDIVKPAPLTMAVVEVDERLAADGSVLRPLDERGLYAEAVRAVGKLGCTTAAIVLMHSYRNPDHERRAAEILSRAGFSHISTSADLAPRIKMLPRAQTAVVNAYLAPTIGRYVSGVSYEIRATGPGKRPADERNSSIHFMTSAGGLVRAESFCAKDSLLSGPAGGVVGAVQAGRRAGFDRLIAFDMGGTSTDVARYDGADGDYEYTAEHRVGDAHLFAPALAIESVAAGGGSICSEDRHSILTVGPASAGADPGPACYGAGGPLTVTDVNLLLGRLVADRFEIPLSPKRARAAAEALLFTAPDDDGYRDRILSGLIDIANERMAEAIRGVSLRRGYDPRDYALVSFGGAGGQHCCAVASLLEMRTVIVPPDASLLSALGLAEAVVERFAAAQVLRTLAVESGDGGLTDAEVDAAVAALGADACRAVAAEADPGADVTVRRRLVDLRLLGQESTLTVEFDPGMPIAEAFRRRYESVYGHRPSPDRPVEVESIRVVASTAAEALVTTRSALDGPLAPAGAPAATRSAFLGGAWTETAVVDRGALRPDSAIPGPALIVDPYSTIVVEPGWSATLHVASGAILLTADVLSVQPHAPSVAAVPGDPIQDELFAGRFAAIASEMGDALQRTALSTNVKERLDYSCALLDPAGQLVATAAHIPVHLGALGVCVRSVIATVAMEPGDVIVTNHPAFGGSHLPDVTVITPVHEPSAERRLLGYVASRAHHAEIGGSRPGSMPPDAATLAEEGVVIPPTYLIRAGEPRFDAIRALLESGPYPSRSSDENLADLDAALAAGRRGADALIALAARHGSETVWRQMDRLQRRAEQLVRSALDDLRDSDYAAEERLDDGTPIAVKITVSGEEAIVDFTGSGPTHPGNLNAPPAVTASAVLYVLRLLVGEPVPLNEGLLAPVTLILPDGSIVNPRFDPADPSVCPAVVGGNTEVSQRIVDTLLKALGVAACSQGTMNNLLWGGGTGHSYYETICGGAGATSRADGASAVHVHMTNTRITDPEILEHRYPVRLDRFAIRPGSGGAGRYSGGDGAVREFTFLAPLAVSMLTQHRVEGPYGAEGGAAGQPGRQRLVRAMDGREITLASTAAVDVVAGDWLVVETPGGGGWGTVLTDGEAEVLDGRYQDDDDW
jgi:5-oxoprolinase (ATP-hydrolysing)